jgi:fatty acid-binding protein DegV
MSLTVVVRNINPLSPYCDIVVQLAVERALQKSTGFCGHVLDIHPIIKIRGGEKSDIDTLRKSGVDIVRSN